MKFLFSRHSHWKKAPQPQINAMLLAIEWKVLVGSSDSFLWFFIFHVIFISSTRFRLNLSYSLIKTEEKITYYNYCQKQWLKYIPYLNARKLEWTEKNAWALVRRSITRWDFWRWFHENGTKADRPQAKYDFLQ